MMLAIAMLPVGVFAVAQGMSNYSETKNLRREAFALGAVEASQDEQAAILEAFGALGALDTQLGDGALDRGCGTVLSNFIGKEPTATAISFIAADGIMRCSHPESPTRDYSARADFQAFLASPRRSVTAQERGEISGLQVIVISQPVYRDGKLSGELRISISSRYLEWVARTDNLAPGARFAIVTADGTGVAQSKRGSDFDWLPSASLLRTYLPGSERILELPTRANKSRIFAIAPLFERDIFAIASWPGEVVPASLGWQNLVTISLPILMWALAVGVAYFAVDQLALRHILYLDRLVTAYGRSGRALRAQRMRDAPTEIAKLGASFDEMAEEIETRENALLGTVQEKEILLREVNHRVKNNLQLISSLLNLQIRDSRESREKVGLERLQERIQGLALVHQKIYESEKMNAVRLDRMIAEIASNLRDGSARTRESVKLVTSLDPVMVAPDVAVPLVLFATEAIVNAFKHSLSFASSGRLDIVLKVEGETMRLGVTNSLHAHAEADDERRGIGQQLIDGFARQLRGEVSRNQTSDTFSIDLLVPMERVIANAQKASVS